MQTDVYLHKYRAGLFLECEMLQTKIVQKIKHTFYVLWLFLENRAICQIMWKNMVQPDRPQTMDLAHAHWMLDN
jgi:hypothetical protein